MHELVPRMAVTISAEANIFFKISCFHDYFRFKVKLKLKAKT